MLVCIHVLLIVVSVRSLPFDFEQRATDFKIKEKYLYNFRGFLSPGSQELVLNEFDSSRNPCFNDKFQLSLWPFFFKRFSRNLTFKDDCTDPKKLLTNKFKKSMSHDT